MGFWDIAKTVGKGAGALGKGVLNSCQQAKDLSEQWAHKDRAFILDKYRNGNAIEKMAAGKVAKDNGWKR